MAEHAPDIHREDPNQAAMFELANTAGAPQLEVAPEALPPAPEAPAEQPRVKMMFVHGEDKNSKPVHIPRDADKQVEWVNSPYNNFTLDRNQFRALSPEARNAYATAQLRNAQEQAKPAGPRIEDRLGDARADEEAQAKLMAEEARAKAENARGALNGKGKPHDPKPESQIPAPGQGPEAPKMLDERLDPLQLDRLDEAAEAAVLSGDKKAFHQMADTLGVTGAERDALIDIATKTTAARRQATRQIPVTNLDPNDPQTPQMRGREVQPATSARESNLPPATGNEAIDKAYARFLADPRNTSYNEKVRLADAIVNQARVSQAEGDDAAMAQLEGRMDAIFSSLGPDEHSHFMDRYKPQPLQESTPAPEQAASQPPQQPEGAHGTAAAIYENFKDGKLTNPRDREMLCDMLLKQAQTAQADKDVPKTDVIVGQLETVLASLTPSERMAFAQRHNLPLPQPETPSVEPPNRPRTYKEVIQGMSFEERRDEAVHLMNAAHNARANGREDLAQELFDRVHDVFQTFTPQEADAWSNYRNANPQLANPPRPEDANTNTGRTETPAGRDKRIRDAFLMGEEARLTPDERIELMLALTDEGDNVGANELYNRSMTKQEQQEFRRRQALRRNGNAVPQPDDDDQQPAPVGIDVDDFTVMSKSGRYTALNKIADYAHDLMDKKADPKLIEVVWEQFDELYDTLTPKQRREFRSKVSNWEFDDVNGLERFVKHPIKTTKEGTKAAWKNSKDYNSVLRGVEKQRIELGVDANGDWIDMPIRNRAEDEVTSDARYADAANLRKEADSLNRWAHPIKKFKLNAEAREQERAYRVETMEPVDLTPGQRRRIGLPQVYEETRTALFDPRNARWLSNATKMDLYKRAESLVQSEHEFDPNQFTGPQYAGTARTLVPGSWRRNRRYIGPGRVTDLQQRLDAARREADYNYSQWRLRQQRAEAAAAARRGA